jgi:hypothetical protein
MTVSPLRLTDQPLEEGLVEIDGQGYYAVPDVDGMAPFLMSIVSDGDRWMFLSSTGGLTAGRGSAAGALFPYETDDRLHEAAGRTGPVTALLARRGEGDELWRPFHAAPGSLVRRFLYKSVVGDSVLFEERHLGLRLVFRYRWASCDRFGFVRTASLVNTGDARVEVDVVDGLVNLLPHGIDPSAHLTMSNLTNAYKRSEVIDAGGRLAVFSLESPVADRPVPAEVLRASVVWSVGLEGASVSLDSGAVSRFVAGGPVEATSRVTGRPGAYLLSGRVGLGPGEDTSWHLVADVARDQADVVRLRQELRSAGDLGAELVASVEEATDALVKIMAPADAMQRTGDRVATAHHFANVTYNVMRGGVPLAGYDIAVDDFASFVRVRDRRVAARHEQWLASLPRAIPRRELLERVALLGDGHLRRLALEYLPFGFSRRHGDPSRPWNAFSIQVRDSAGRPTVHYEGNWRDIFQNWEALCMSFPDYLPGVVSVFVNASTPDGFNPYRITREGFDWEVPDPDDPWSNIGYWGDHQIVYLLRLLELGGRYLPGRIEEMLGEAVFSYAEVPYRIVPYDELVRDPKATIVYDEAAAVRLTTRAAEVGADGKLLGSDDGPHLVTLVEKLVVPALAKLSNFVPGGGIWMNTQRPEWNDGNNALVGYGLSVVTLYQLRRYLVHLGSLLRASQLSEVAMSAEVAQWLDAVTAALGRMAPRSADEIDDRERKRVMDELGAAFSAYRSQVYASGFSGVTTVSMDSVAALCDAALEHLDPTIRASQRDDGLFHSYNLVRFSPDGSSAAVEHLHEMLEGQVAALESGVLDPEERADVVDALFASAMYRADQKSFLLYPARQLPSFLEKNVISAQDVQSNPLLAGNARELVAADADGRVRFHADLAGEADLEAALDRLAADPAWSDLVAAHRDATRETYERVFRHHAYTGRSGSMYAYEGIGSIYWHMVAKLLVAVQESLLEAATSGAAPVTVERLRSAYWRIRSGLGFNKTASEFGAIPTDPYSHTPAHAGAQQPGMTGLVKEELLTRPLELGVRVEAGEIRFDPLLLRSVELLDEREQWHTYDVELEAVVLELEAGSLGMTLCQVPIVVAAITDDPYVEVVYADGSTRRSPGTHVDEETSAEVFARSGRVRRINAWLPSAGG